MLPHRPEHCQAAKFIEAITGINKGCPAWIYILIHEICGFQEQQSPPVPPFRRCTILFRIRHSPLTHIIPYHFHCLHCSYEIVDRPALLWCFPPP